MTGPAGIWWNKRMNTHRTHFNVSVAGFCSFIWSVPVKFPIRNVFPHPLTFSDHRISEEAWEAGSPPQHPHYTDEDREVQR